MQGHLALVPGLMSLLIRRALLLAKGALNTALRRKRVLLPARCGGRGGGRHSEEDFREQRVCKARPLPLPDLERERTWRLEHLQLHARVEAAAKVERVDERRLRLPNDPPVDEEHSVQLDPRRGLEPPTLVEGQ